MPTTNGIFYAQRGAGPPLLCLHGAGGIHTHWSHLLIGLTDQAQVLALDLPGHGRSAPPALSTIGAYAETSLALLDTLGIERVLVAGHSMGAAIAIEMALAAPERVAGLALIGAAARLRVAPTILNGLDTDPLATIDQLVALMYPHGNAGLRERAAIEYRRNPATLRSGFLACDGWDARQRLSALSCPSIVITGEADKLTPPKLAGELAELLGGARLVLLPAIGHVPMLEASSATLDELRIWLKASAGVG